MVSVPLLGVFSVFYGWRFNRELVHPDSAVKNTPNAAYVPGCKVCDELREAFEPSP